MAKLGQQTTVTLDQTLTLTPQLKQALRVLGMSALELEAEVSLALESNPMLERADEQERPEASAENTAETSQANGEDSNKAEREVDLNTHTELPDWRHDDDLNHLNRSLSAQSSSGGEDLWLQQHVPSTSLREHLLWQLDMSQFNERQRAIGQCLIDAIKPDGYLGEPLPDLAASLPKDWQTSLTELTDVLSMIQTFDPTGVGAQNPSECLCIQLDSLRRDTHAWASMFDAPYQPALVDLAETIATEHLNLLARGEVSLIKRKLQVPSEQLDQAIELLQQLNPKPGLGFDETPPEYIEPDVYVEKKGHDWHVRPARHGAGLSISKHYQRMMKERKSECYEYLSGQLQEARWLMKNIEARQDTVTRVAQCLVQHQRGFFDHGPEAMRPMVLRDVAAELELHESTISRATSRKFLRCQRGTFELKYFFSQGPSNSDDGDQTSSTAIQAVISRLVASEDPRKPLSDSKLVALLDQEGIEVARRTVAKYRDILGIASSSERKRLS